MARALFIVLTFVILITSCTQRMVCPAYQSAYIHDKDALRKKFSYFVGDSTPKVYASAKKNKYLVAENVPYKKKVRSIQTVAMIPVNPVVPDSLKEGFVKESITDSIDVSSVVRNVNDGTAVLRIDTLQASVDSLGVDSVYVISKDREVRVLKYDNKKRAYFVDTVGFNTQQDSYMWYLRDWLVLPDARIAQRKDDKEEATEGKKEKGGFFKNLFGKKKKKEEAGTDISQDLIQKEEEDYGYDDFEDRVKDSTATTDENPVVKPTKEKKKKTRKPKVKKADKKKTETPPAKKEDEDDGF
jgi:hypothetical protein